MTVAPLAATTIHFATSNGGGIQVNGVNFSTSFPSGTPTDMMGLKFDGTYNLGTPNDWADIFGEQGQFRFELDTLGGVDVKDLNAPSDWTPASAGTAQWAIQNYQSGVVKNSVMRGTIQTISLSAAGHFQATLVTDGAFHWYYGSGITPLSSWGLDGLVYVSGDLIPDDTIPGYYHNSVILPPDHRLHFSFGVPDNFSTLVLTAMGLAGLAFTKLNFRRK